jgi:hypothetical protein
VCSEKEKRDEKNKKKGLDSVGIVRDARLDVSIPSTFSGQRGVTPALLDMALLIRAPEGL